MSFGTKVYKKTPICPKCEGYTTYIHDLKCPFCDNKTVVWCPQCRVHIEMKLGALENSNE